MSLFCVVFDPRLPNGRVRVSIEGKRGCDRSPEDVRRDAIREVFAEHDLKNPDPKSVHTCVIGRNG
jgi:hypothetical protein